MLLSLSQGPIRHLSQVFFLRSLTICSQSMKGIYLKFNRSYRTTWAPQLMLFSLLQICSGSLGSTVGSGKQPVVLVSVHVNCLALKIELDTG